VTKLDRPAADSGTTKHLLRGGLPSLLSSVITALIPAAGAIFLAPSQYAVWALAATLTTIFLLVDFGTTGLATKLAAEGRLTVRTTWTLNALTASPPLLLTLVTLVIWPYYARTAGLVEATAPSALLLIALVGIGTALRSFGLISASISLGRRHYGRRSAVLLGGAAVQAIATLSTLAAGLGYLALGVGVVAAGLAQLIIGSTLERSGPRINRGTQTDPEIWPLVRRFASSRGAAVLLGVTITQLDRWSLGLFAGAAILTAYDLTIRFATMPKIALLAFGSGLITEASGTGASSSMAEIYRKYTKQFAAMAAIGALPAIVLAAIFAAQRTGLSGAIVVAIVCLPAVAHAVNSWTIPASFLAMGAGRPELELLYLAPLALLCTLAYVAGNVTKHPEIQVWGWSSALVVLSTIYVVLFPKIMHWRKNGHH
jgi:O-antigen/teichoic acid export membrane protein